MKLKVQMLDLPGGRHLVVTDENDEPLPMISSVEIKSRPDDIDKVVVTFILDDDLVKIVQSK